MTVTTISRNVLPAPLPDRVYVRTDLASFMARLAGRMTRTSVAGVHVVHKLGCIDMPVPSAGQVWRGSEAWRTADRWCEACFPGGRCPLPVTDSLRHKSRRCGQPTGNGTECRWHFDLDVNEDKRIGRAA